MPNVNRKGEDLETWNKITRNVVCLRLQTGRSQLVLIFLVSCA